MTDINSVILRETLSIAYNVRVFDGLGLSTHNTTTTYLPCQMVAIGHRQRQQR